MDQTPPAGDPPPPVDPTQPAPAGWAQPAQPSGPTWGQPAAGAPPPPAPGAPAWGQPAPGAPPSPAQGGPGWAAPAPQQPPAQAGWGQPAPAQTGWVVQAAAQRGPVTGLAKIAGLIILLFGLAWTALGVILTLAGGAAKVGSSSTALPEFVNGIGDVIAGLGIVILVVAIIELLGGIGILLSKDWGRIIGIIYSLIFGAGSVFIVLGGSRASSDSDVANNGGFGALIFGLVFLIGYLYSLVILGIRWRGRARA